MQKQRNARQGPFAGLVLGLKIEGPYIGWATGTCFVDGAFVHVPHVLLVLGNGLRVWREIYGYLELDLCKHAPLFRRHRSVPNSNRSFYLEFAFRHLHYKLTRILITGIEGYNSLRRDSIIMPCCISHLAPSI